MAREGSDVAAPDASLWYHLLEIPGQRRSCSHRMGIIFFSLGLSWGFGALSAGCTWTRTQQASPTTTRNTVGVHLPRSSEPPVSARLPPAGAAAGPPERSSGASPAHGPWIPSPAEEGSRLPEGCGSGENAAALGDEGGRPPGSAAQQVSEAWSHLGEATPHVSKPLTGYVRALPPLSASRRPQPARDASSSQ